MMMVVYGPNKPLTMIVLIYNLYLMKAYRQTSQKLILTY